MLASREVRPFFDSVLWWEEARVSTRPVWSGVAQGRTNSTAAARLPYIVSNSGLPRKRSGGSCVSSLLPWMPLQEEGTGVAEKAGLDLLNAGSLCGATHT